ncbi:MAG: GTPase Era [Clostridia bacterium]|nr:GTPase Era [Clostridia bacterium]
MKRSGFITIIGKPNVGKSTLLNTILGEKIAIVSSKPQTTRTRIMGILTKDETQFVFLDTPGVHKAKTRLGDIMVKNAVGSITGSNCVIFMTEAGRTPDKTELMLIEKFKKQRVPTLLVINKVDSVDKEKVGQTIIGYSPLMNFEDVIPISALKADGIDIVLKAAERFMTEERWFFPDDMITDQPERQIAAEIIREKILRTLDKEIPHGTAVVIEEFKESNSMIKIRAEIFCEKASHKGIIIGKNGASLKRIGTYAREDMEQFFGVQVFVDLWVKVKENWRDSVAAARNFGFNDDN